MDWTKSLLKCMSDRLKTKSVTVTLSSLEKSELKPWEKVFLEKKKLINRSDCLAAGLALREAGLLQPLVDYLELSADKDNFFDLSLPDRRRLITALLFGESNDIRPAKSEVSSESFSSENTESEKKPKKESGGIPIG